MQTRIHDGLKRLLKEIIYIYIILYFPTRNRNESFCLTLTAVAALQWQCLKVELCCTLDLDRLKQTLC